ncbi:DUF4260 domain-containing protein [Bacillus sp. CGMCC 1.16607]|uniref:DUF4260 domain-containing protein n=1 Tax=Bacillus sp. CGMCC 1.16607 TaxID=3351842 RepID=UPI00364230EE
MSKTLLRLEGLIVFLLAIGYYHINGFSWLLFIIFLLAPDVGMIGYAFNNKLGAYIYNGFHTYAIPLTLLLVSFLTNQDYLLIIGLIWTAHIGMDRALGYGLKKISSFKDTHLAQL